MHCRSRAKGGCGPWAGLASRGAFLASMGCSGANKKRHCRTGAGAETHSKQRQGTRRVREKMTGG